MYCTERGDNYCNFELKVFFLQSRSGPATLKINHAQPIFYIVITFNCIPVSNHAPFSSQVQPYPVMAPVTNQSPNLHPVPRSRQGKCSVLRTWIVWIPLQLLYLLRNVPRYLNVNTNNNILQFVINSVLYVFHSTSLNRQIEQRNYGAGQSRQRRFPQ